MDGDRVRVEDSLMFYGLLLPFHPPLLDSTRSLLLDAIEGEIRVKSAEDFHTPAFLVRLPKAFVGN